MNILDLSDQLHTITIIALILAPWFKILATIANGISLKRGIKRAFAFLPIISVSISRTGLELAEVLAYVSFNKVFKGLKAIGERLVSPNKLYSLGQAVDVLTRTINNVTRLLPTEYATLLSSGTTLFLFRSRSSDIIKTITMNVNRLVQSKVTFGLMLVIALSVAPSLALGTLMPQNISIEGTIVKPGLSKHAYSSAIVAILPLILMLVPRYQLSMITIFDKRFTKLPNTMTATGVAPLALLAVVGGDANTYKDYVFNYAFISLVGSLGSLLAS